MKPERGKALLGIFLLFYFVSRIRSSLVFCFGVTALPLPIPSPVVVRGGRECRYSGNDDGSGTLRVPRGGAGQPRVLPALRLPIVSAGGRQTNSAANRFCSGNAAVGVSQTVAFLARNCSAEARVGQRQTGHRQTMPAHVQKCQRS